MIIDGFAHQLPDIDPEETEEWLDSLDAVLERRGGARAQYLMARLIERARERSIGTPASVSTPYVNTIPVAQEPWFPGDEDLERHIRRFIRWNAAAMVVRANKHADGIGGHLSTFASSAALYEVGFNHFFRGKSGGQPGDHVYIQGHAAPGVYARAFLEHRLDEADLDRFRLEIDLPGRTGRGLSSYPHPRLMPEFWEYPTVSMGLGPILSIYQARFNQYLQDRRIDDAATSRVWCYVGDGEVDEPETLGAISLAAREQLDNLTWVINCNLQRLDGPVRGSGKVMQELEAIFRGSGWNVIKVVWGGRWDELLARDTDGVLLNKMNTTVDGEFQRYAIESGDYIREHFFGPDPRLRQMVEHLSDEDLQKLPRGGHDYRKLYAAYRAAVETRGVPTVVLAKTVKGWTLGPGVEARNSTHQIKKMSAEQLMGLRDRLDLGDVIPDEALAGGIPPYVRPADDSEEMRYLLGRREALDGFLPSRVVRARRPLAPPSEAVFKELLGGSGAQAASTTTAFTRLLRNLCRDGEFGRRVVPIIPDEARTFGMDAMFPSAKIYSPHGQTYEAVDRELLLSYKEAVQGQILHEGISESGSMASAIAAGTSYATHGEHMIPIYIFYSMFGWQRTGDQMWQMADQLTRGFLLGATAGRTTLNGEGLQHEDGHTPLIASTNPAAVSYDPSWAFEVAHIVKDGLRRMYGDQQENVFYYLTVYNEPYLQPAEPANLDVQALLKGLYKFADGPQTQGPKANILSSGVAGPWAMEAQRLLAEDWGVSADVWSATSWSELRREALACEEHNLLNPEAEQRVPYVTQALSGAQGPFVGVSDYMKAVQDQIAQWVPGDWSSLGTDGFGLSDTRSALRRHFHVDAASITLAVLTQLVRRKELDAEVLREAIARYHLKNGVTEAGGAESNDTQSMGV